MASLISAEEIYSPVFTVKLVDENENIPGESISSIEIDENLENPAMFKISFNETLDINTQKFKWLDDDRIAPGKMVVISFGYATTPGKQGLIRGRIKAISPGFLSSGIPTLNIEGYDLSHDLQKTLVKFKDIDVAYSDVAAEIAKENGLDSGGVETTKVTCKKVERKKNEMDYAILQRLSNEIGFEFFVRDKTLYFRKPQDDKKGKISFELRKNFISFNPRITTANLVNEVEVTAWNEKDKEKISETAGIDDIKSSVGISDFESIVKQSQEKKIEIKLEGRVVCSKEHAKSIAVAELKRRNRGYIEGSLECIGNPELIPGMTVNIDKVGERFSGVYYITKARHAIGEQGYKTTLEARRSL